MTIVVLGVAVVAGWVSYWHAVAVIERYGAEDELSAHLVPVTVDGMIYASSMVLLWCARYQLKVPALARWALALGIAATLAANILHGVEKGALAAALAAWPAVALVISYELTMWVVRSGREVSERVAAAATSEQRSSVASAAAPALEGIGEPPAWPADRLASDHEFLDRAGGDQSVRQGPSGDREFASRGGLAGQARRAFAASLTDPAGAQDRVTDRTEVHERLTPVSVRADERSDHQDPVTPDRQGPVVLEDDPASADRRTQAAALLARDPHMSGAAVARALGVSEPHGRRLRREVLNESGFEWAAKGTAEARRPGTPDTDG
ncbi:hypothetical protein Pth03_06320 [Planotetraspora thailandica]|uniref:DUF2637 domain-containing protein n=1 Tax=Planotetraspora thailandica TaxID=487172 RepID=A0A8J3UUI8_9ACTN|nr:DUF2637 domain-containing protein [Planotetraspora thailandica]GII52243.1 hypothetical protein Pth03_06320 [Planotetraspora thailandica]